MPAVLTMCGNCRGVQTLYTCTGCWTLVFWLLCRELKQRPERQQTQQQPCKNSWRMQRSGCRKHMQPRSLLLHQATG